MIPPSEGLLSSSAGSTELVLDACGVGSGISVPANVSA